MFFVYEFIQKFIYLILKIFTLFVKNKKFLRFVQLRDPLFFKDQIINIKKENINVIKNSNIFWIHVASAGEMEQAIPVARKLTETFNAKFFVTYYSPSAEPFLKNFPNILLAVGLPIDIRNIFNFAIRELNIKRIFFVRYDIWPALFKTCIENKIEINLLSASEKKTKAGFLGFLSTIWNKKYYKNMNNIFAVSKDDYSYFTKIIEPKNVYLAGDAKWARAYERAVSHSSKKKEQDFSTFFSYCLEQKSFLFKKCIVFGFPHTEEHEIALKISKFSDKIFSIYVPHDTTEGTCLNIKKQYEVYGIKAILYSELVITLKDNINNTNSSSIIFNENLDDEYISKNKINNIYNLKMAASYSNEQLALCEVIIFDKIGYLAEIYELADVAIVGGGFDGQIHNVLEPAAHGVPVLFGNLYQRAREAHELVSSEAAISFQNTNELFQFLVQWVSLNEKGKNLSHPAIRLGQVRTKTIQLFKSIPDTSEIILKALQKGKHI